MQAYRLIDICSIGNICLYIRVERLNKSKILQVSLLGAYYKRYVSLQKVFRAIRCSEELLILRELVRLQLRTSSYNVVRLLYTVIVTELFVSERNISTSMGKSLLLDY